MAEAWTSLQRSGQAGEQRLHKPVAGLASHRSGGGARRTVVMVGFTVKGGGALVSGGRFVWR